MIFKINPPNCNADAPAGLSDAFPRELFEPLIAAALKRLQEPKFTAQVKGLFQDIARFYGTRLLCFGFSPLFVAFVAKPIVFVHESHGVPTTKSNG